LAGKTETHNHLGTDTDKYGTTSGTPAVPELNKQKNDNRIVQTRNGKLLGVLTKQMLGGPADPS